MNKPSELLKQHIADCIDDRIKNTFKSVLPHSDEYKLSHCKETITNNWKARMSFQKALLIERKRHKNALIDKDALMKNNANHFETYIGPGLADYDLFVVAVTELSSPIIVVGIFYEGTGHESLSGITAEGEIVRDIITWLPLALTK